MVDSAAVVQQIREEFPGFRIVYKDRSRLSLLIDWTLRCLTLGGQRHYLTRYHTVIGHTLYVPRAWDHTPEVERVILLRHERVHLRQRRRLGFLPMAFVYLIPFFPLGLAYGRARLEWEAYTETLRATSELLGLGAARSPELRRKIVGRFTGPDYGWMWPFPGQVQSWYDQTLKELEREASTPRPGSDRQPV